LDPPGIPRDALLSRIKLHLAYAIPVIFGFTVFSSYGQGSDDGKIPYPSSGENAVGGHAILAVDWWTLLKSEWVDTKRFNLNL
jgi:C1A family cysteine protease